MVQVSRGGVGGMRTTPQAFCRTLCAVAGVVGPTALAALAAAQVACVATQAPPPARGMVVNGPPPAPVAEVRTAAPSPDAVWIEGYWHWTGLQYTWIPGHWESPPVGTLWQAPRYSTTNGVYLYEPGAWSGAVRPVNASGIR